MQVDEIIISKIYVKTSAGVGYALPVWKRAQVQGLTWSPD